jgi:iron complex transport system substrate-binding protein
VLFAVGAGEIVNGVTTYCNYPLEAMNIGKIGGFSAKTISIEAIVALEPDLVFADLSRHGVIIETLEGYGISVIATNATSIDHIYDVIGMLGAATGTESTANSLVASMKARIDSVSRVTGVLTDGEKPKVFWEVFDEPLMTAGPDTFIGQLIDLAGGINLFSDVTESWPQISHEELLSRNPEVLMSSDNHGEKFTAEAIISRRGWRELDAVRNRRIYLFDGDMVSRPGPRIVDVLVEMAAALHPELF